MPRTLPAQVPVDERAVIVEHRAVAPGHRAMRLRAPNIARVAAPGHFVQIRVADRFDPLLRRPMSIGNADPDAGTIDVMFKVTGAGTTQLAERAVGEEISVLGPLGHPFVLPADRRALLVGGGVGMPPLYFAARRLPPERTTVVQGARTVDLILYGAEFRGLGVDVRVTTDDGSAGVKGLVTDALRPLLSTAGDVEILACGPTPMLVAVANVAREYDVPCQVSLEEHMACGIGICMGCAVREVRADEPRYSLVCVDGPVFDARDVFPAD